MKYLWLLFAVLLICCKKPSYQVVYANNKTGNIDMYLYNSDDTISLNLFNSESTEYGFTWSGDGMSIYYTDYLKEGRAIKKYDIQTTEIHTIIQDSLVNSLADVSEDGTSIIFTSKLDHPKGELYEYQLESKSIKRITFNELYEAGAKYSPDKKEIVASIQTQAGDSLLPSGIAEIFQIDLENLKLLKLTSLEGFNGLPAYSPDGKKIAFHRCSDESCDIYVISRDGSVIKNLTNKSGDNRWPRWSPDGKWIAFTRTVEGNSDIYLITPEGFKLTPIIVSMHRDEIAEFNPTKY